MRILTGNDLHCPQPLMVWYADVIFHSNEVTVGDRLILWLGWESKICDDKKRNEAIFSYNFCRDDLNLVILSYFYLLHFLNKYNSTSICFIIQELRKYNICKNSHPKGPEPNFSFLDENEKEDIIERVVFPLLPLLPSCLSLSVTGRRKPIVHI